MSTRVGVTLADGPSRISTGLRAEWGPTARLALPVVLSELGWMVMGLVDTYMVGGLGPEAIGAVGIGGSIHMAVVLFGIGLLLGLDTLVSQAFGAERPEDGQRALIQGLYLGAIVTLPLMLIQFALGRGLARFGVKPEIASLTVPYMDLLAWSTGPLLVYSAFRRYLQGMGIVRPLMASLLLANLVNWLGNWFLIAGRGGFPRLGVDGSGWSTSLSRVFMAALLIGIAIGRERGGHGGVHRPFWKMSWRFDPGLFARLIRLGLPAAVHLELEVGVFAVVTTLAGCIDADSLAAHQIALNLASLTFMIPLGIAAAGTIRVGQAIGRGDPERAVAGGWAAIWLGLAAMAASGLTFLTLPRTFSAIFSDDARVVEVAVGLLGIAAAFQLFDGLQVVATGVLRGAGDTRTAMATGFVAYWVVGLPLGSWLGLTLRWGVFGLWIGLMAGLIVAALILILAWKQTCRRIRCGEVRSMTPATAH